MLSLVLLAAVGEVAKMGASIGAGLAVVGAGIGVGITGGHAMDAMARQPEMVGTLRSNMILAAALVEGVAFFALVLCLLAMFA
jgi:F-type H+-transporting ATPase subunit c